MNEKKDGVKDAGTLEVKMSLEDEDFREGLEDIKELVEETTASIEEMTEAMKKLGKLLNEQIVLAEDVEIEDKEDLDILADKAIDFLKRR